MQIPQNWKFETANYKIFDWDDWKCIVQSKSFSRGEAFYVEILPNNLKELKEVSSTLFYKTIGREIPINKKPYGFNGIYVFPPDIEVSYQELEWKIIQNKKVKTKRIFFPIHIRSYPISKNIIQLEKLRITKEEEENLKKRIQEEKELKRMAFVEVLPLLINQKISHPRDYHFVTSEWYKKRLIQYYEYVNNQKIFYKPKFHIHYGVDLKGQEGDVVYALADGKVVLSKELYFEGNYIIINHGSKIFSGYMHLKERFVPEGSMVVAGIPIGKVGSTGFSTAPHLHFSLWIDGYSVDPLSILYLPLR
ncbi:MAG: M23 family metallopeptidase [Leptonema sp. (in: bacteria)]